MFGFGTNKKGETDMTVRELRNMLDDIEDQDAELVIFSDPEGNEVISEVEIEKFELNDGEDADDYDLKDGAFCIIPTGWI